MAGTKSSYSRSGARRSGDDYQDVIALDLLIQVLEHPDRYRWVQVEADDFGYLDDIVALRSDGRYIATQVKFSTKPEANEDNLTWDDLLAQRKAKNNRLLPSLLQKWSSSLEQIRNHGKLDEASVVSNRQAGADIKNLLSPDGLLDFDKISDGELREKVIGQSGDESKAREFFANFHFYLDKPGLADYEKAVQKRFYSLAGRPEGWLNLKDTLRSWIRIKTEPQPEGLIRLQDIRKAALWGQLRLMPQNFEIPDDYVLPEHGFYDYFKEEVISGKSNCLVLYASPGVGKSTFLSYLCRELKKQSMPVLRHHYFLSLSDRTPARLEHSRIAECLMSEIMQDYSKALGNLAANNPDPANLSKWVETCGQYFKKHNQCLTIIIDGLDHVWREQSSVENLNKLFEHLLSPPEGVTIVIGTQPLDDAHLPSRLRQIVPGNQWQELPLMDLHSVKKWLKHHEEELQLPDDQYAKENVLQMLGRAFFRKSGGHPLHLKYTLKALSEQNMLITENNIQSLPGCPHRDIRNYYNELWVNLPEESRQILHLFAATDFAWLQNGIMDCLDPQGQNLVQVNNALRQVRHLMSCGPLGLRAFHTSLLEFIKNHIDHKNYAQRTRELALNWLQTKAPKYWKWAHEWRIEHELGNCQPIVSGISREWCVKAIAKRYPGTDGYELLTLCLKTCLELRNLPEFVRVGLLRDYYGIAYDFRYEALEDLLVPQLVLEADSFLMYRAGFFGHWFVNNHAATSTEIQASFRA